MSDIINQLRALALYAAKAIVALAAPTILIFATDALAVLAARADTFLAAAVRAVARCPVSMGCVFAALIRRDS